MNTSLTNLKTTRATDLSIAKKKLAFQEYTRAYLRTYLNRIKRFKSRIKKKTTTLSGHHVSTKTLLPYKSTPFMKLFKAYALKRGRCTNGKISVYSKGSCFKKRFISYASNLNSFKCILTTLNICKDPHSVKTAILCAAATGETCYVPMTSRLKLFKTYFGAEIHYRAFFYNIKLDILKYRPCEIVSMLNVYTAICCVADSIDGRIKYARASGSFAATVQRKAVKKTSVLPIQLPSGQLKQVEASIIVLLGYILPKKKHLFKNTRAGYWRNLGKKPMVRGIVKNPVDHPHGGRAKTILWPRTPWGKSTK